MRKIVFFSGFLAGVMIILLLFTAFKMTGLAVLEPEPYAEATVIELNIDLDDENCANSCTGYKYPRDNGIIRIDFVHGNVKAGQGDLVNVNFLYSARPSKLKPDFSLYDMIGNDNYVGFLAKPIPSRDGYFIYNLPRAREKILPGLREGNKIRIMNFNPDSYVGEYEILAQ